MASRPSLLLPGTVGVGQAADAARDALCALLTMKADPADLEPWLAGPYRQATRFAASLQSGIQRREDAASIIAAQRRSARVVDAASRGSEALVRVLPPVVHIRPAHDRFGGRGFIAFDVAGAPLIDKAVALADYFTRPEEFLARDYESGAALLRRISGEVCAVAAISARIA